MLSAWLLGLLIPTHLHAMTPNPFHPAAMPREKLLAENQVVTPLTMLINEALQNNPEIQAALRAREAAQQRISPAEALDDPMLAAGVINVPLSSSPFNREDMTMKMIGLSQRIPFPGKRGLRKEVATREAQSIDYGYLETVNRIVRDLKVAYFDLGLTLEMTKLAEKQNLILEHLPTWPWITTKWVEALKPTRQSTNAGLQNAR